MTHVLVIRLSAMGDVAITVPVVKALVQQHSYVRVTVVSRPFFKPFFEGIDQVDFFSVDLQKRHKGFLGIYRLYHDLKKLQIDAVADFHNVLRSKILRTFFKLSGTKTAFTNKGRAEKKALTRTEKKVLKPLKSMINRHIDTLVCLGFRVDVSKINFPEKSVLPDEILAVTSEKPNKKGSCFAAVALNRTKVDQEELMRKVSVETAEKTSNKNNLSGRKNELQQLGALKQHRDNVSLIPELFIFNQELQFI